MHINPYRRPMSLENSLEGFNAFASWLLIYILDLLSEKEHQSISY